MSNKTVYEVSATMVERVEKTYNVNIYKEILALRKFEIENFWKRSLFFWGTISLLYLGFFRIDSNSEYSLVIALLGLLFNIIFSLSIRGSKYWQEHYEDLAEQHEQGMSFVLFSHKNASHFLFTRNSVLSKPHRFSVSKLAMLLADLSAIVWFLIWINTLLYSFTLLKFDFSTENQIHIPTIFIVASQIVPIAYFIYFLKNGNIYHKPMDYDGNEYYAAEFENSQYEEKKSEEQFIKR